MAEDTAKLAWAEADGAEGEDALAEETSGVKLCQHIDDNAIRKQMKYFTTGKLKWAHRDLHDASVSAGLNVPTPCACNSDAVAEMPERMAPR